MLGFEYQLFLIDDAAKDKPLEQFWAISDTHGFALFQVCPHSELWIQQPEKQGFAEYSGSNNYLNKKC